MELILNLLYFYIAVYSVYFFAASIKNLNDKKFVIQQKYSALNAQSELCLIVYSHNNQATLGNLIKQLKSQDYPVDKFSVYVILDNCSDDSEKLFINENFIKVFNISDQDTVGKDQAISILLEKLSTAQNFNAYVFLDANRYVEENFLNTVNAAIFDAPVVSGSTVLVSEYPDFKDKIKMAFHKYYTNFIQKSRSAMGLASIIDSDILIIRQEVMEKIGCVDFQNINSELKYSLLLSKIGFPCTFSPNIKTYIDSNVFDLRIPSLSARINLFKNCITQLFTKNFVFTEHVFSLLNPNVLLLVISYLYLLKHSFKYYFIVDFSVVLLSFIALILGFSMSLINSKLNKEEILYLFLYPFYSIFHIVKNVALLRRIKNKISGNDDLMINTEKLIVDVLVTDGKSNISCKLELISENGLAKVKFMFKKKKFVTSSHLRMFDALQELILKLSDYGFVLKVCQCCKNFTPNVDGSTNMVKGFCNNEFTTTKEGKIPTLLWNSCRGFNQTEVKSVIEEISK